MSATVYDHHNNCHKRQENVIDTSVDTHRHTNKIKACVFIHYQITAKWCFILYRLPTEETKITNVSHSVVCFLSTSLLVQHIACNGSLLFFFNSGFSLTKHSSAPFSAVSLPLLIFTTCFSFVLSIFLLLALPLSSPKDRKMILLYLALFSFPLKRYFYLFFLLHTLFCKPNFSKCLLPLFKASKLFLNCNC